MSCKGSLLLLECNALSITVPHGSKACHLVVRAMCIKVNMSVTVQSVTILNMNVMQGFMVAYKSVRWYQRKSLKAEGRLKQRVYTAIALSVLIFLKKRFASSREFPMPYN